jgi:DNA-binding NtrC family response regulator
MIPIRGATGEVIDFYAAWDGFAGKTVLQLIRITSMNPDQNRPSILLVEDDSMVLATLKLTLEHEQYDVTACSGPLEALPLLPGRDFAVIISDHKMPEMTGLAFLAECKRLCPHSSRILLTAVVDLATIVGAINRGEICRFIAKPWLRVELIAAVRDAVQRHDLTAHNHSLQVETARLNKQLTDANRMLELKVLG